MSRARQPSAKTESAWQLGIVDILEFVKRMSSNDCYIFSSAMSLALKWLTKHKSLDIHRGRDLQGMVLSRPTLWQARRVVLESCCYWFLLVCQLLGYLKYNLTWRTSAKYSLSSQAQRPYNYGYLLPLDGGAVWTNSGLLLMMFVNTRHKPRVSTIVNLNSTEWRCGVICGVAETGRVLYQAYQLLGWLDVRKRVMEEYSQGSDVEQTNSAGHQKGTKAFLTVVSKLGGYRNIWNDDWELESRVIIMMLPGEGNCLIQVALSFLS